MGTFVVELERFLGSVDGNGNGSDRGQSGFQGLLVTFWNINETFVGSSYGGFRETATVVLRNNR